MPSDAEEIGTESQPEAAPKGNGKMRLLTLADLDGRTLAARRARELVDGLASDLGGADRLTVAERQLCQRAAVLGAIIEHQEAAVLAGNPIDVSDHLAAVNAQRRVLTTIGLERRARDVTPDLRTYLAERTKGAGA